METQVKFKMEVKIAILSPLKLVFFLRWEIISSCYFAAEKKTRTE